jgi:uncharacterized protein
VINVKAVDLLGVKLEPTARIHVLLLQERDGQHRVLPIGIGAAEAEAISLALEKISTPRPLTHDLLQSVIEELGGTLRMVHVNDYQDHTFYAELHLEVGGAPHVISARPSDSIALAARVGCPIQVAESVLDAAGQVPEPSNDAPEELFEEFQAFIENVSPDDFAP